MKFMQIGESLVNLMHVEEITVVSGGIRLYYSHGRERVIQVEDAYSVKEKIVKRLDNFHLFI